MDEETLMKEHKRLEGDANEYFNLLFNSFKGESERSIGIVSICVIDEQLEKLFRSYFIKDAHVSSLFRNEHILQTYYAKCNIAYYAGLIPKWCYADLTTLGAIRNKFAHQIGNDLSFSNPSILALLNKCTTRLKFLDGVLNNPSSKTFREMSRLQYIMITARLVAHLSYAEKALTTLHFKKLTDLFNVDESDIDKMALTKSEFLSALSKGKL